MSWESSAVYYRDLNLGVQERLGGLSSPRLVLSTVDPYFTMDGVSRAIDLAYRTSQPLNSQGEDYKLIIPSAAIRFGVPFSELDTVFFGLGYEQTEIRGRDCAAGATAEERLHCLPASYSIYRQQFGGTSNSLPLTLGWARDGRDSAIVPTTGRYQRVNIDWSAGGDARYVRTSYQFQQYFALTRQTTFAVNAELGIDFRQGPPTPEQREQMRKLMVERGVITAEQAAEMAGTRSAAPGEVVVTTRTVYRLPGGDKTAKPEPVSIKVGITDGVASEIIDGLKEGDTIITGLQVTGTGASATPAPANIPFGGGQRRF